MRKICIKKKRSDNKNCMYSCQKISFDKKFKKCMRKTILMKYENNIFDSCLREEKMFLNF